jgi:hypothetical protein
VRTVRPTTVEEYRLLLCLGKELKMEGQMPPLAVN